MSFTICDATSQDDISETVRLFTAYSEALGIDLTFQNFNNEMITMPGKYAAPKGCLLLLKAEAQAVGCVGLRPLTEDTCEMKRLYVSPKGRGMGAGKALANAIIQKARQLGYARMRLDTLSSMTAALQLYKSLGF